MSGIICCAVVVFTGIFPPTPRLGGIKGVGPASSWLLVADLSRQMGVISCQTTQDSANYIGRRTERKGRTFANMADTSIVLQAASDVQSNYNRFSCFLVAVRFMYNSWWNVGGEEWDRCACRQKQECTKYNGDSAQKLLSCLSFVHSDRVLPNKQWGCVISILRQYGFLTKRYRTRRYGRY